MQIGLDIGFGDVKIVCDGGRLFSFPSAIKYVNDGLDLGAFSKDEEFSYGGRKYLVGEQALLGAFSTQSIDFLGRYAPLLAYKAITKIGEKVDKIGVGLPLDYYTTRYSAPLKKSLGTIEVNGEKMIFDVEVYPQGVGVLLDFRLAENGSEAEGSAANMMVLDIGFNTVDVVAVNNGSASKADSGMLERAGIAKITQELSQHLRRETNVSLSDQEAKDVLLQGSISLYGHTKDLSEVIRAITEEYIEWLLNAVQSRWEEHIQRAKVLLVAGGGAYYLKNHIPDKYRTLIQISKKPEFANARGFLKALKQQES